jgi:hypothetical protein
VSWGIDSVSNVIAVIATIGTLVDLAVQVRNNARTMQTSTLAKLPIMPVFRDRELASATAGSGDRHVAL